MSWSQPQRSSTNLIFLSSHTFNSAGTQLLQEGNPVLGRKFCFGKEILSWERKSCCQQLLGDAEPPPISKKSWSKASQAGLEKTESRKELILALGTRAALTLTILVLICFPWLRHKGWNPIRAISSWYLKLQTPPEISAGILSRQISTGKESWNVKHIPQTSPDEQPKATEVAPCFSPGISPSFWSRLKLSWHQKFATEILLEICPWRKWPGQRNDLMGSLIPALKPELVEENSECLWH